MPGMEGCVGFGDVIEKLKGNDRRLPVQVSVELTRRCTFRCPHCYCRLPEVHDASRAEMRGDEWARILREAADEGAVFLQVTGGEPLLHPDFREIWVTAKRLGLIPDLYTNGSLITPELADFLAEWPPRRVSVTLYGATEGTYRSMTGTSGMLEQVLSAVSLLRERGVGVEVKGMFTRSNAHELPAVRAHAAPDGGTFRWGAELIGPLQGSFGRPESVRLSGREIVELEKTDPVRWAEWEATLAGWKPAKASTKGAFRCGIGESSLHVDPYGKLRACEFVESVSYDVRRGTIREGWRTVLPELLGKFPWSPGSCQACALADVCRICPAHALLAGQPATGPTEMHCDLARARAESFGLPVLPNTVKT